MGLALLILALVLGPMAAQSHALSMQGDAMAAQEMPADDAHPPCHEVDSSENDSAPAPMPCCPEGGCSGAFCLMQFTAVATEFTLRPHAAPEADNSFRYAPHAHHPADSEPALRPPIV